MDAVVLALASAALFGSMTVALQFALARSPDAEVGALHTIAAAFLVTLPLVAAGGDLELGGIWPFLLAGILGPGASQLLFTLAVRDAGPSRTSVTVGTAPLFSVAIALALLDEPAKAGVIGGALLVVVGGILLVREPGRPEHVKWIGLGFAFAATIVFAARDSLVRHLSLDTEVEPALAAAATLLAGGVTVAAWLLVSRRRLPATGFRAFLLAGALFGLSYLSLFEAYYRGRVSVVSPLVATESLWGVALSALLLRRRELVGPRVLGGAALVVAGGVLIAAFR
ncbi:MAG: DMT family transporter [Actinomycetota bacterium]|nr:DMT family transporter [Actinomycetota bacterium]